MNTIHLRELYAEGELFAQGVQAENLFFLPRCACDDGTLENMKQPNPRRNAL